MIPVYNRVKYLRQALESVLSQRYGQNDMQIEVVDDCSSHNESEAIVKAICPERISIYRQPRRLGLVGNWNACIERALGRFVHILHDDDFVESGYYREIESLAEKYPDVGLYSTRCFFVDADSIISGITDRVRELERPGRSAVPFFYAVPIQFPGVTVRRTSYEVFGGFRSDLKCLIDCEMWARVTSGHGAVVSTNIRAFYRVSDENESTRVLKTGEAVRDVCRLSEIFSQRYREFSVDVGRANASRLAWELYHKFKSRGDDAAAAANWDMWLQLTPVQHRLARRLSNLTMPYIRRLAFGTRA
jgi:glycosyltransferase involved in cell wall biosynthesis